MIPFKLPAQTTNLGISHNERPINCLESSKYLGVNFDNKLNFKFHIGIVKDKVAKSVGILNKLCYLFSTSALFLLHYSLNYPHFLFGLSLWETPTNLISKLPRLQNKAIRIITDFKLRISITPYYHKLGILKLPELYTSEIAKHLHQYSHHTLSTIFYLLLPYMSDLSERRLKTKFTFQNFLQQVP